LMYCLVSHSEVARSRTVQQPTKPMPLPCLSHVAARWWTITCSLVAHNGAARLVCEKIVTRDAWWMIFIFIILFYFIFFIFLFILIIFFLLSDNDKIPARIISNDVQVGRVYFRLSFNFFFLKITEFLCDFLCSIPGGPMYVTSYDYNAPLDEYGAKNEPKYSHLKQLHLTLMKYSDVWMCLFMYSP
jgi:hypothetical protein